MPNELDKKVSVSLRLLQMAAVGLVVATFTVTRIYDKFEYSHLEQEILKNRIEYVDGRINRKADPIEESVVQLKEDYYKIRIRELEEEIKALKSK